MMGLFVVLQLMEVHKETAEQTFQHKMNTAFNFLCRLRVGPCYVVMRGDAEDRPKFQFRLDVKILYRSELGILQADLKSSFLKNIDIPPNPFIYVLYLNDSISHQICT